MILIDLMGNHLYESGAGHIESMSQFIKDYFAFVFYLSNLTKNCSKILSH